MIFRAATSLLLAAILCGVAEPAMAQTTTSVPATSYDSALLYAQNRGLLQTYEDGLLHPERRLTRVDLITAIVSDVYSQENLQGCFGAIAPSPDSVFSRLFTDVSTSSASAPSICIGMWTGIVDGRKDGSFGPQDSANLVEVAKIVSKAYGIAPGPAFRPQSQVPWHERFWYALARRQAIPASVTSRDQALSRGEFAQILYAIRSERPSQGFRYDPTTVRDQWQREHRDDRQSGGASSSMSAATQAAPSQKTYVPPSASVSTPDQSSAVQASAMASTRSLPLILTHVQLRLMKEAGGLTALQRDNPALLAQIMAQK